MGTRLGGSFPAKERICTSTGFKQVTCSTVTDVLECTVLRAWFFCTKDTGSITHDI